MLVTLFGVLKVLDLCRLLFETREYSATLICF